MIFHKPRTLSFIDPELYALWENLTGIEYYAKQEVGSRLQVGQELYVESKNMYGGQLTQSLTYQPNRLAVLPALTSVFSQANTRDEWHERVWVYPDGDVRCRAYNTANGPQTAIQTNQRLGLFVLRTANLLTVMAEGGANRYVELMADNSSTP